MYFIVYTDRPCLGARRGQTFKDEFPLDALCAAWYYIEELTKGDRYYELVCVDGDKHEIMEWSDY